MALENILERIRAERDEKIKEIREEALDSAGQKKNEGKKKGELLKKEILAKAREEAGRARARIIVNARIQIKKDILSLKQNFTRSVFVKAFDSIKKSEETYRKFIEKILFQFVRGDEEIILSSQDRKKFSERWLNEFNKKNKLRLKYCREAGKISGGVIIRSGRKEINASLKILIKETQGKYEAEIAKILFGEL